MAITFVGSNVNNFGTSSGSFSINLPAMNQNDLVLLFVGCGNETIAGPPSTSGYTLVADLTGAITTKRLYVARKFMGVTPDTLVSIPSAGGDYVCAMALVFRGVHTTTPLDVAITTVDTQFTTVPNPATITPISNDCCIVIGACGIKDTGVGSVTNYLPSPSVQSNTNQTVAIAAAYRILGAATAEDPLAWSTWDAAPHLAITIALRPLTASVDFVTVDPATITVTGKSITVLEITPVSKASVGYAGRTVNIPDGLLDSIFVDAAHITRTGQPVEPIDIIRSVTVTKASVLCRGRTVTPRDIQFEDIPRYAVRGRGSGIWMETR